MDSRELLVRYLGSRGYQRPWGSRDPGFSVIPGKESQGRQKPKGRTPPTKEIRKIPGVPRIHSSCIKFVGLEHMSSGG